MSRMSRGWRADALGARLGVGLVWLFASAQADAVVPQPGDTVVAEERGVFWHVDGASGDRTVISSPGAALLCSDPGVPYDCCTGGGTGDGTGACATVGAGVSLNDAVRQFAVTPSGDVVGLAELGVETSVYRVDLTSGDRSMVSCRDHSLICLGAGDPLACCTGAGTGNGVAPCAQLGGGGFFNPGVVPIDIEAFLGTPPQAVAALPTWGLPVLAGILLGLSMRAVRKRPA